MVDDFQPFRRFIRSAVEEESQFEVVGEAEDGLEAIHKAEELQPDLILLDIGLPKLDGIPAARQIRRAAPKSKIIFFSQNHLPEIVEEALSTGASGYIVKSEGDELFTALETVVQGNQFLSRSLRGPLYTGVKHSLSRTAIHEVQFYSNESVFLNTFANFITPIIKSGDVVIVTASERHRNELASVLQSRGVDVTSAAAEGYYVAIDPAEPLSGFMVNDVPNRDRFFKVASDVVERAANSAKSKHSRISACGEVAPTLWAQGKADAAIRIEQLWDEIVRRYDLDTLCAYPLAHFHGKKGEMMFKKICAEHTTVRSC